MKRAVVAGLVVIAFVLVGFAIAVQRRAPDAAAPTVPARPAHETTLEEMIAFHDAARGGDLTRLAGLVSAGVPVDVRDQEDRTPLAVTPSVVTATWLIEKGADVNARNDAGQTVLMQQAEAGNAAVVQKLVRSGAALDAVDARFKLTALAYALHNERMDVVQLLREAGAHDDTVTERNGTSLAEMDAPVRAAHAYLDAVFAADAAKLRTLATGPVMSFDRIDFNEWKAARPHPSRLVSGWANNDAATLELRGPNADRTMVTWRYDLVRQGRDWKVTAEMWETRFNGVD